MKRYIEFDFDFQNDPESANLHLWLPETVLSRMDAAMYRGIRTREDFATYAILWALRNMEMADAETMMGLER